MNSLTNLRGQFAAELTRDEMKNVVGGIGEWEEPGDGEGPDSLLPSDLK